MICMCNHGDLMNGEELYILAECQAVHAAVWSCVQAMILLISIYFNLSYEISAMKYITEQMFTTP